MSLIASISGVRGEIGGSAGNNLTPQDLVRFTAAYGTWLQKTEQPHHTPIPASPLSTNGAEPAPKLKVVVGRDARPSGAMVSAIACATLTALGIDVIDLGLATTPTVEVAVPALHAAGGIIFSASHNPVNWNALKLLNKQGEFISAEAGADILALYHNGDFQYAPVQQLGSIKSHDMLDYHINQILALPEVDVAAIQAANFKVAVDSVNSVGGIAVPRLLAQLGVMQIYTLNGDPTGWFAHNPEPLAENLTDLCAMVKQHNLDMGIAVDPDVDRLAFVSDDGTMFGEEYTLVAVTDYLLSRLSAAEAKNACCVSNLSSSRALRDVALRYGAWYYAAAVGEVNVVQKMKATGALIGGEGNGGVIYPKLHYGRDALVGIALVLTFLAHKKTQLSTLRASYPNYYMAKEKIALTPDIHVDSVLAQYAELNAALQPDLTDGVKIDYPNAWVHLRKSNTEPIIRIYTEAPTEAEAQALATSVKAALAQS